MNIKFTIIMLSLLFLIKNKILSYLTNFWNQSTYLDNKIFNNIYNKK
jgi:hypothetical protein